MHPFNLSKIIEIDMKRIIFLLFVTTAALTIHSCTKLDVPVDSQYVAANFPVTTSDYSALLGTMYSNLSSNYAVPYWRMQELSTDEAILPARDGNFDDGGQYRQLHYHTWTFDHPNVIGIWQWGFGGINTCNRLINLTNSFAEGTPGKATGLVEIKAMRALYYYFMMDLYGNVPLIDTFPVANLPATQPRIKVFQFIESELKSIVQQLPVKNSSNAVLSYGRPTKAMAFALLEKMYLNAEVYIGTPRYTDAVAMADSILVNNNYSLDGKYTDIFAPNNGPQISETIFAIPYDQQIPGNQFTRFGFFYYLVQAYGFNVGLSIAMSTTPEFWHRFNLPGDIRNTTWLAGKQYAPDANKMPDSTKPVFYPGTTTQVEITPDLILVPPKPMDVGNTIASQSQGVRSVKFYPDPTIIQSTRLNGNDVPVFRLADVMMMKAEAILRGAAPTAVNGEMQTPDVLVNKIRARAGAPLVSGIDLPGLLDERAREFSWEAWRRNDLIRFNQFEQEYPLPNDVLSMNKDVSRRLYPVPSTELKLNPNLVQNPGY